MKQIKGTEALGSKEPLGMYGDPETGFASGGPFSCMDCVHRTPHSLDKDGKVVDSCKHPKIVARFKGTERELPDGMIFVDQDDCCQWVRPEDWRDEEDEVVESPSDEEEES